MEKQVCSTTNQREGKNRGAKKNTKFVGVRQRPSGKWVAEIKNTSQKIRMWLGTFDTADEAARAYDEAARLLRGSNTRTNFVNQQNHPPPNSALSLKIRNLLNHKKGLKQSASKASATQSSIIATTSTSTSCTVSGLKQDVQFFNENDAYKPDLSDGFEMGAHQFTHSSSEEFMSAMGNMGSAASESSQITDFERIKVERQISASLYAMNGVNEYWENVHDSSAAGDAFWDLPMSYFSLFS